MKNNGNAVKNMSTLTDSRIIKLQQLQEHIQTVTSRYTVTLIETFSYTISVSY